MISASLSSLPRAYACSCANITPKEAFENSIAVFSGTVISIEKPALIYNSIDSIQITFDVSRVWKGSSNATISLSTAYSDVSCGYPFTIGKAYFVYAHGEPGELKTNLCSGTKPLELATTELELLGYGVQVIAAPITPQNPSQLLFFVIAVLLLLSLSFMLAIRVAKRKN
jgi:hypothetical protein